MKPERRGPRLVYRLELRGRATGRSLFLGASLGAGMADLVIVPFIVRLDTNDAFVAEFIFAQGMAKAVLIAALAAAYLWMCFKIMAWPMNRSLRRSNAARIERLHRIVNHWPRDPRIAHRRIELGIYCGRDPVAGMRQEFEPAAELHEARMPPGTILLVRARDRVPLNSLQPHRVRFEGVDLRWGAKKLAGLDPDRGSAHTRTRSWSASLASALPSWAPGAVAVLLSPAIVMCILVALDLPKAVIRNPLWLAISIAPCLLMLVLCGMLKRSRDFIVPAAYVLQSRKLSRSFSLHERSVIAWFSHREAVAHIRCGRATRILRTQHSPMRGFLWAWMCEAVEPKEEQLKDVLGMDVGIRGELSASRA